MRYEKPEMEVVNLTMSNVITDSLGNGQGGPVGGEDDFGGY
jgi:hypothetical protein